MANIHITSVFSVCLLISMLKNQRHFSSLQTSTRSMLMDSCRNFSWTNLSIFFSLMFGGFFYVWIWSTPSSSHLLVSSLSQYNNMIINDSNIKCPTTSQHELKKKKIELAEDKLKRALEKAATANKTVIIAIVNKAYVEENGNIGDYGTRLTMFDIFVESFWVGEGTRSLIKHLLVVAMDQTAYDRCMFKRLNCYKLKTEGLDYGGEAVYMSPGFVKMMWTRTLLLLHVLKRGYNFIFTDTDVLWLRNPFDRLNKNESADIQMSTDMFFEHPRPVAQGNGTEQLINTGFYFVKSSNKTIALLENWYARKDNSTDKKEQDVLLDLLREGFFDKLGLNTIFLDTLYFSGFCQDSKDILAVVTVHSNCCRSIQAKVRDLTVVLRDWKRFKSLSNTTYTAPNFRWTGHFGCWNSWGPRNNTIS